MEPVLNPVVNIGLNVAQREVQKFVVLKKAIGKLVLAVRENYRAKLENQRR